MKEFLQVLLFVSLILKMVENPVKETNIKGIDVVVSTLIAFCFGISLGL